MKYEIIFEKQVKKFIEKQDKNLKQRIRRAFKELEKNPYPSNPKLDIENNKSL